MQRDKPVALSTDVLVVQFVSRRWCGQQWVMALHFTMVSEADEANLSRMSLDSSKATNKGPLP